MKLLYVLCLVLAFEGVVDLPEQKVEQREPKVEQKEPKVRYHGYAVKIRSHTYYFQEKPVIKDTVITFKYLGDIHTVNDTWYLVEYK